MASFEIPPAPEPKERLTVRLPGPLLARLGALASKKHRTVSAVVVALLEAALDEAEKADKRR